MKKKETAQELTGWDAFIESLENLFYPGAAEMMSPEEISYYWKEFSKTITPTWI